MKNLISSFTQEINQINDQIEALNGSMEKYVKDIRQGVKQKNYPKVVRKDNISERVKEALSPLPPPSSMGIDYKKNPLFLKVAEFFGVDWKEYPLAVSKLAEIIDWAASEVKSNNFSDIILKISNTSKKLRSSAYSEKPYAILYRYVKLESDKIALDKALKSSPEKSDQIKQEQHDIQKEMQAYQA